MMGRASSVKTHSSGEEARGALTLLAGLTREAYHSGLFGRSIQYLVTSAFTSWNAISTCGNMSQHIDPREKAYWTNPLSIWAGLQNSQS